MEAEDKGFEPGLRPWKKRKVKESKEGKGLPLKRESGLEEEWSRMRPRVARSWTTKRRRSRRNSEILKKFSCVPKAASGKHQE